MRDGQKSKCSLLLFAVQAPRGAARGFFIFRNSGAVCCAARRYGRSFPLPPSPREFVPGPTIPEPSPRLFGWSLLGPDGRNSYSFQVLDRLNCQTVTIVGPSLTRVLFQARHDWFRPHQYRYCVDRCGGAVLVKQLGGIAKFLAVSSPTFQRNHAERGGQPTHEG